MGYKSKKKKMYIYIYILWVFREKRTIFYETELKIIFKNLDCEGRSAWD